MADKETLDLTKLDGSNYPMWKFGMMFLLEARELIGFVEGTQQEPDKGIKTAEWKKWMKNSSQAAVILLSTVDRSLHPNLINCSTPKVIWEKLKGLYGDATEDAKQSAWERFYTFKINGGEPIARQIEELENIRKKWEDTDDKPSETAVVTKLLNSHRKKDNLVSRILREEKRLVEGDEAVSLALQRRAAKKKDIEELKKRTKCGISKEKGHWARECSRTNDYKKDALYSNTLDRDENVWIADSGAGKHMTGRKEFFKNIVPLSNSFSVQIADDKTVTDKGFSFHAVRDRCEIRNSDETKSADETMMLWHKRLGHINVRALTKTITMSDIKLDIDKGNHFFCESCVLGEQTRKPHYAVSDRGNFKAGENIHTDVCGPIDVKSYGGSRYFLLFKDHSTDFRKVYFMQHKSETLGSGVDEDSSSLRFEFSFGADGDPDPRGNNQLPQEEAEHDQNQSVEDRPPEGRQLRDRTRIRAPERYGIPVSGFLVGIVSANFEETVLCPDAEKWKAAMKEELTALEKNDTWSLTRLPPDKRIVGSKWVFTIKSNDRYKVREDFEIMQFDVKTAFLYGDLQEDIYLQQPEGYTTDSRKDLVCKLHRSLYGLKQSPRNWNEKFVSFLKNLNFSSIESDQCVFVRAINGVAVYLALYVYDGLLISACYADQAKGLRVWIPQERKVEISRDVKFLQTKGEMQASDQEHFYPSQDTSVDEDRPDEGPEKTDPLFDIGVTARLDGTVGVDENPGSSVENVHSSEGEWEERQPESAPGRPRMLRTGKPGRPRKVYQERNAEPSDSAGLAEVSIKSAISGSQKDEWMLAMADEFISILKNKHGTWLIVLRTSRQSEAAFCFETTYLNGVIEEEIFMEVPNYTREGSPLYGLKQAGRCWYRHLSDELIKLGATPTAGDASVYVRGAGDNLTLIVVYVDDILIISRKSEEIDRVYDFQRNSYDVKDLGNVKYCLGIEFSRHTSGITLRQKGYINDLLNRFNMAECNLQAHQ
ncbi:uncharacterized protein LOC143260915 [Megalopta genalis]|uniref:uncharacterized protein LOC143260915 n=1 Tax=Megalopta genalis TaxID=115081 RepID=UPI003FD0E528